MTDPVFKELQELLGTDNIGKAQAERFGGDWAPEDAVPAWLLRPSHTAEVAAILRTALRENYHVVPVGTGTRHPNVSKRRGLFLLDLSRFDQCLRVDENSLLAHVQSGMTGLRLDELLGVRGLTVGAYPPSVLRSTLGGLFSVRTAGKVCPLHGDLFDAVRSVSVVLPDARIVHTRVAPRKAAGPDFIAAFLGAEGSLGIVIDLVLRVHRQSKSVMLDSYRFESMGQALACVDTTRRQGARPAALRVFNHHDSLLYLGEGLTTPGQVILAVASSGHQDLAALDRDLFAAEARRSGAVHTGLQPAETWWRRRYGHSLPGPIPPPPSAQFFAPIGTLPKICESLKNTAQRLNRDLGLSVSRYGPTGASLFVGLYDERGSDTSASTMSTLERAALSAGASPPGSLGSSTQPYLQLLRNELDDAQLLNPNVLA